MRTGTTCTPGAFFFHAQNQPVEEVICIPQVSSFSRGRRKLKGGMISVHSGGPGCAGLNGFHFLKFPLQVLTFPNMAWRLLLKILHIQEE